MTTQAEFELKQNEVEKQAALVRKMKAEGAERLHINHAVDDLKRLKEELKAIEATLPVAAAEKKFDRAGLDDLLKKRFFFYPSFSIYGGVSGLFDYGPPGCALQANILDFWRKFFVLEEDMLEVDCTILTPHDVLKTSGHVDRFADLMCKDLKTGEIFRVDHLVEAVLEQRLEDDQLARDPKYKAPKGKVVQQLSAEAKAEYQSILAQVRVFSGITSKSSSIIIII